MSTDREQITDLLIRYATALDTRDWHLFDSCFTEDAIADYGTLGGHNQGREANATLSRSWRALTAPSTYSATSRSPSTQTRRRPCATSTHSTSSTAATVSSC